MRINIDIRTGEGRDRRDTVLGDLHADHAPWTREQPHLTDMREERDTLDVHEVAEAQRILDPVESDAPPTGGVRVVSVSVAPILG